MAKALTPNMKTLLGTLVSHGGSVRIYDPDAKIDGNHLAHGHMGGAIVGLINRGLVQVVDHQVWVVTPAGHDVIDPSGYRFDPN